MTVENAPEPIDDVPAPDPIQLLPRLLDAVLGSVSAAVGAACACAELLAKTAARSRRGIVFPVARLDEVARLLEAVGRGGGDADSLDAAAGRLRAIGAKWDATDGSLGAPWDRQYRWDDAPALADVCASVAGVAARQRGLTLRDRPRVGDRLRDAALFLADIDPARVELLPAAMDLAWAAGMIPPLDPPTGGEDTDAVIRVLATGVALAATLADREHPSTFLAWRCAGLLH